MGVIIELPRGETCETACTNCDEICHARRTLYFVKTQHACDRFFDYILCSVLEQCKIPGTRVFVMREKWQELIV